MTHRLRHPTRRHAFALAAVLALVPAVAGAQTVRGVVLEEDGTNPIAGATIELLRADSTLVGSVTSDRRGWFHLEIGHEGRYLLRPAHPSFVAMALDTVSVGRHEIVTVVLRMGRSAIPLAPLVVTARSRDRLAGFYERSETLWQGRFIFRPYIERRIAARPTQLLRMTPGVEIMAVDNGLTRVITMRSAGGGGWCPAAVFLDGLPVPQNLGMSIDEFTASTLLEGVEIYDAYTPTPVGLPVTMNTCGIVAFWTRRESHRPWTWKKLAVGALLAGVFVLSIR